MYDKGKSVLQLNKEIGLRGINYNYTNESKTSLKDIELNIPARSTVGYVGATGSGKTTIVDIILGLLEAQKGTFQIDGQVINKQNRKAWQRSIGYVQQQTNVADDPIEANISFDITNHKDKDKRIRFKKKSSTIFFLKNKEKFDLILIKQTIHLMNIKEIKILLNSLKRNINQNGKILIFTLDTNKNELPTFDLMKKKLIKSLKRDKKIMKVISDLNLVKIKKKFIYKVKVSKRDYLDMIKKRYISILLKMSEKELFKGIKQITSKYGKNLMFRDKLICIIL